MSFSLQTGDFLTFLPGLPLCPLSMTGWILSWPDRSPGPRAFGAAAEGDVGALCLQASAETPSVVDRGGMYARQTWAVLSGPPRS